jgi:DNA replication protein DnaC
MSNNTYKQALDVLAERRQHNELKQRQKEQKIYREIPGFEAIDAEISGSFFELSKNLLNAEENGFENYKDKLEKLKFEKEKLLIEHGYPADYLEPEYFCNDCRDKGYISPDGELSPPEPCHCLKKIMIEASFNSYSQDKSVANTSFDDFSLDYYSKTYSKSINASPYDYMSKIKERMTRYASQFDMETRNLLFYGSPGTGKTFMSTCIANALLKKNYELLYFTADQLINQIRSKVGGPENTLEEFQEYVASVDLLILDDMGAEHFTEFGEKQLYQVINRRLLGNKRMIISTNLTLDEIRITYTERLSSRLLGSFATIHFVGDDIRLLKRKRK